MSTVHAFHLSEIAGWQTGNSNTQVGLPTIQRGFVWKPSQIEILWDSVLRGFPISSFLLSSVKGTIKKELLDGQQRATSLAIDYYNPWRKPIFLDSENGFWKLKSIPVLWIDLANTDNESPLRFPTRLVTQSHPWGYQLKDSSKILSVSDRRQALEKFTESQANKGKGYTKFSLTEVFPYDAVLPVPLCFAIEATKGATDVFIWKNNLLKACKDLLHYEPAPKGLKGTGYFDTLENLDITFEKTRSLYDALSALETSQVPFQEIPASLLEEENKEENVTDPTLFVRLNSQGTKLAGEELIYSIYKSFYPEAQQLVENISASFLPPSFVISLIARLAYSETFPAKEYTPLFSVKDFQKRLKLEAFKSKMGELIGTGDSSLARALFKGAFSILLYKENEKEPDFGLPPVLMKIILRQAPDIFLLLLRWLKNNNSDTLHSLYRKKIISAITALSFFAVNYDAYAKAVWSDSAKEDFWEGLSLSKPFLGTSDYPMVPLIKPADLRAFILRESYTNKRLLYETIVEKDEMIFENYLAVFPKDDIDYSPQVNIIWNHFINRLRGCRQMLLYAQRTYLQDKFKDFNQMDSLEDTNAPWDWDHIYPESWTYYRKNIPTIIKHLNNCIGNIRALALEANRGEGNLIAPSERLVNAREESFVLENDYLFWSAITHKLYDQEFDTLAQAILNRLANIYEGWYNTLEPGTLFGPTNDISTSDN